MLFWLSCFFVVVSHFFIFPFFTFHPLLGHNKCNVDGKGPDETTHTTR